MMRAIAGTQSSICGLSSPRTSFQPWRLLGAFVALISWGQVDAASPAEVDQCLRKASNLHQVDYRLLRAIGLVESRLNPKAVNKNTNGTGDTGMMQINDWWLPTLSRFNIKKADLFDPCTSAYVGAWILAHEIKKHGMTWRAVGAYNSPNEKNQQIYAQKVFDALREIP